MLCAVSGGADSMCLLHLLWSGREQRGISVAAAHFEHGLRGEESLRDAAFVEDWCRERGIPLRLEHGDAAALAAEKGLGVEEAARELRYAFLERAADALGCDRIATAHNADDNAETMLLNLCRGAGSLGLGGIPPARGRIVRPLLKCGRGEIEAYLREQAVPHVEDSSNRNEDYSRNRLRSRVLPVLRELNPAFTDAAGRTAELLRRDEDYFSSLAESFLSEHFDGESLELAALNRLHPALAARVLRSLLPRGLSMAQAEDALRFCRGTELAWLDLPGQRLRRERGRLWLSEEERCVLPERSLRPGETIRIPEAGLSASAVWIESAPEIYDLFKTLNFKSENICGKVILCTGPGPGDRMHPVGRGCGKSLKALFAEAGWTRERRERTPVFRDEEGILAVCGLAVDERAAALPGERALQIRLSPLEKRESTED